MKKLNLNPDALKDIGMNILTMTLLYIVAICLVLAVSTVIVPEGPRREEDLNTTIGILAGGSLAILCAIRFERFKEAFSKLWD